MRTHPAARILASILLLPLVVITGLLSRWHGSEGGAKILKSILWATPFSIGVTALSWPEHTGWLSCSLGLLTLLCCAAGKSKGHGGGIDMGHNSKVPSIGRGVEDIEWPQFLLVYDRDEDGYFSKRIPISDWWYDFILMSVKGVVTLLVPIILFSIVHPFAGALAAYGGVCNGLAYAIGWNRYPTGTGRGFLWFREATQIAEFLGGCFAYAGFAGGAFVVASVYGIF